MSSGSVAAAPDRPVPAQVRASDRPGKGASRQAEEANHGRRDIAQGHRFGHHATRRHVLRVHDHQRDADQLPVEAATVREQEVIAEMLAVIRGDDDQRTVEHPAAPQLLEEDAQLPVHVADAFIVEIDRHLHVIGGPLRLIERVPALEGQPVHVGNGPQAEGRRRGVGDLVGRVGVVIVEEGEERPVPRPLPG